MEDAHMTTLSPNEAAKRYAVSRRTIMRAIETGKLIARRDNRNQWQVEESSLAQWAAQPVAQASAQPAPTLIGDHSMHVLEERVRGLEALLTEMRSDRDAWRAAAQKPWWKRLV